MVEKESSTDNAGKRSSGLKTKRSKQRRDLYGGNNEKFLQQIEEDKPDKDVDSSIYLPIIETT